MCSGGGDGGAAAPAQASAPSVPTPAAAPPLSAPEVPKSAGGTDPTSPGYRGFTKGTAVRKVVKQGGQGSGTSVPVSGGSGIKM
jgi:hypothetical protein